MKAILAYGPALRTELEAFIADKRTATDPLTPWASDFLERFVPFATAGKLIRGNTLCFTYEAFAGRPLDRAVLRTAMALELTHSALLIHDDIMDNDDLRRGRPAIHRQYESVAEERQLADSKQFGLNMALCGGDTALFLAFELLSDLSAKPATARAVRRRFADCLETVCAGQMEDVYLEARSTMPPKRAIYGFMKAKTASYTLTLPLILGAVFAEQPSAVLRKLTTIGSAAGTIFQIRDDELGALGRTQATGKPVGADIREGKKTLLHYYLLKRCSPRDRKIVKNLFGQPEITGSDIAEIQNMLRRYRIPQLLNGEVARLQARAVKTIDRLPLSKTAKAELRSLVKFCARRQG